MRVAPGNDRITYDSLWVHGKRHYDLDGLIHYRADQVPGQLLGESTWINYHLCPGER